MKFVVEPGQIDVYAGNSSDAELTEVVHGERDEGARRRARLLVPLLAAPSAGAAGPAPGAPGEPALWTEGDKDGFGTATALRSTVWHTLDDGELTEVYYPDLGTPAVRDVQLVVTDGRTFADREREDTEHVTRLVDRRSLTYRQVNTDREGLYRITKTYTTDPARAVVLVKVRFRALTRPAAAGLRPPRPEPLQRRRRRRRRRPGRAARCSRATRRRAARSPPSRRSRRRRAATSARATAGPTSAPTSGMDWRYAAARAGQRRADRAHGAHRRRGGRTHDARARLRGRRGRARSPPRATSLARRLRRRRPALPRGLARLPRAACRGRARPPGTSGSTTPR